MRTLAVVTTGRRMARIILAVTSMASAMLLARRMIGMRDEKLVNEFVAFSDGMMGKLLDLYNCDDWGCGWVELDRKSVV